jgi:two-component system sensor histidine kinase DesK
MNSRSPFGEGWWGLVFALSGGVLLIDPMQGRADLAGSIAAIVGAILFIGLFALILRDWRHDRPGLWQMASIAAMGFFFAPFNSFGWILLVVALAFAAPVVAGNARNMALIVGGITVLSLVETILAGLPWSFVGMVVGYGVPTAIMTTVTLRRNLAVRELARYNERERIARDMQDVLGHTLSVIALKTDLAMRLVHANPDRALHELGDVDRLARHTLEEVRQTLRGYRAGSLEQEIEVARNTLSLAGIEAARIAKSRGWI